MHYLDNASTTRPHPEVAQLIGDILMNHWANPAALYRAGMEAQDIIEGAQSTISEVLGCKLEKVFFTGSGTEGNNIAILAAAQARSHWADGLVATGYEHPSVLEPLRYLAAREGFKLTLVAPQPDGRVDPEALLAAVSKKTALLCAMQVNNETGAALDVAALAEAARAKNSRIFVHVDGVQGFCRLPLALEDTQIDSYVMSGHKLHAPKGVGALYLRNAQGLGDFLPLRGGGQQQGVRPGTENTAYIAGFGRAAALAAQGRAETHHHIAAVRSHLEQALRQIPCISLHAPPGGYPGILMFSCPEGLRSNVMLNHLDEKYGVQVSSGSACKGGQPSHTLQAMGIAPALVDTALRVSLCADSTIEDIDALVDGIKDGIANLARNKW